MALTLDGTNGVTFPSGSGTQAAQAKVLQVVNATLVTAVSTGSSTFSDTGLSASITPLFSTSKVLVIVQLNACGKQTGNTYMGVKLFRGSTNIQIMESLGGYDNTTGPNWIGSISSTYLDSPSTTSSTTYKVQFNSQQNVAVVYINGDSNGLYPVSTITLMEIAA
jgi:hypothetical protein